jgi:hypothetical protein
LLIPFLGHLSLYYARWNGTEGLEVLLRGKSLLGSVIDPDSLCSPILEVAYWIGRQPGVDDPDTALMAPYLDSRPWSRSFPKMRDRFVVLHFHFDETRDLFFEHDGHTFVGFVSLLLILFPVFSISSNFVLTEYHSVSWLGRGGQHHLSQSQRVASGLAQSKWSPG